MVPYWLELEALRRVPARVFGVWMSLQPAVAALIGLGMLGQRLSMAEWAGICCVVVASAAAARGGAPEAPQALRWAACLAWLARVTAPVLRPTQASVRGLALAAVIANAVIIATGEAVRLSSSGLGCPDWPQCTKTSVVAAHSARADDAEHLDRVRQPAAELPARRIAGPGVHRLPVLQAGRAPPP